MTLQLNKLISSTATLLLILGSVSGQYDLPNFIQVCNQADPQLNECMKRSVESLRPYLAQGIPELDVPPIEPLNIGNLNVADQGGLKITANNVQAYGPSNFILKKMKVVQYGTAYQFQLEFPVLRVEGVYDIDGRIVLVPVKGNGPFRGEFNRCTADVRVIHQRTPSNGVEYNLVKKIDMKVKVGSGKIKLENLFGGDKVLGDVVNETINRNFDLFAAEIIPLIEKALSKYFKKVSNNILSRYAADVLFP